MPTLRRIGGFLETVLSGLRAPAEATRLRLLLLCARGELTVSEITDIIGQSQPRISRHLKLLCDAGLLERIKEGAWVFYRGSERGEAAQLTRLLAQLAESEPDPELKGDL